MDSLNLIKDAIEAGIVPKMSWIENIEDLIKFCQDKKDLNKMHVLKYRKSENGMEKRRQAQRAYYSRQREIKKQLKLNI